MTSVIEAMARAWCNAGIPTIFPDGSSSVPLLGDQMRAALSAADALGWQMVPKEPTEGMINAGTSRWFDIDEDDLSTDAVTWIFADMLNAAPKP